MEPFEKQGTKQGSDLPGAQAEQSVLPPLKQGSKQIDIVFCGHMCLDLAPRFPQSCPEELSRVFVPGKLVEVGEMNVALGGSVSNSGAAAQKLGLRVAVNTRLGQDAFGDLALALLEQQGMARRISRGAGATSYSVVLSVGQNDRIFLHHTGTNDLFSPEDVDWDALADARLFHFGYPPLMKRLAEHPEELLAIFQKAKALRCLTSLDMALPDPASPGGKANWKYILGMILPYVDLFIPSFEELCFMLQREHYEALRRQAAGGDLIDVLDPAFLTVLSDELLELGAGVVAIKCGRKGYYVRTGNTARMAAMGGEMAEPDAWSGREFLCEALRAQKFVSATGAGDSSIAGFLCAVLRGKTPEQAAKSAVTTAWHCLQTVDAASGIPDYSVIEADMGAGLPPISHMDETCGRYDALAGVWRMRRDCAR